MTDQELLELVQTASPAELTLDQIRFLHRRVDESPELREFFSSRLKLQSYLTEAVSRLQQADSVASPASDSTVAGHSVAGLGTREEPTSESSATVRDHVSKLRLVCLGLVAVATLFAGFLVVQSGSFWPQEVPVAERPRQSTDLRSTRSERQPASNESEVSPAESPTAGDSGTEPEQSARDSSSENRSTGDSSATATVRDSTEPWSELFAADASPSPFETVCFDRFDVVRSLPRREDLARWFLPVVEATADITDKQTAFGSCGAIDGLFQLRSPWTKDTALRFSVAPDSHLSIHCFNGSRGVTLVDEGDEFGRWLAFATQRGRTAARPTKWTLAATDGGRCRRSGAVRGADLALRYRAGEMILSHGDLVLLRAPLSGLPQQVYFDGSATFYGISLVRSSGIPESVTQLSTVQEFGRPFQQLDWLQDTDLRLRVETLDGGGVRFARASGDADQSIQLARTGWQGVVWELDDATAGVEIRFIDSRGTQQQGLRYTSDSDTGQLRLLGDDPHHSAPVAGRHWIRLVFGISSLRWWISADGEHWAEPGLPLAVPTSAAQYVAFCLTSSNDDCGITLHGVRQLVLPRLLSLVQPRWRQDAGAVDAVDYQSWEEKSVRSCPSDCESKEWQRACALATLNRGCRPRLAQQLLDKLLDDASRLLSLEQQLELLAEAALLIDGRGHPQSLEQLGDRYRELGQTAFDQNLSRPYSFVRRALLTAPVPSREPWPVEDQKLIRTELLQLVYAARWQEVLDFRRMLQLFDLDGQAQLFHWAAALASREGVNLFAGMIHRRRGSWRELLVSQMSREATTRAAELTALLDSGEISEAARWIAALSPAAARGIVPNGDDPQHASSLATFVRGVIRDYPPLRQQIAAAESGTAKLRVQQAIEEQDVEAVRLAAMQFSGTDGALTAERWLGDRALAAGWFARALTHYRRAVRKSDPAVGTAFSSEKGLAEKSAFAASAILGNEPPLAHPADYQVGSRHALLGPRGRPATEVNPALSRFRIDTGGRQMAIAVDGDTMFVNNRFHVAAIDARTGETMWRSSQLPGRVGRNLEWLLIPMRPLVMADRLLVRQLYGDGPSLVCLDRFSGEPLWIVPRRRDVLIVSDPFWQEQRLVCLTLAQGEQDQLRLRLTQFDADTGAVWQERDLVELRDHWHALRVCQVQVGATCALVTLGGVTLCCEPSGELRWSRRHLVVPPSSEPSWITQAFARPVVRGDVAFLSQPGVRTVECVDVDTGRLSWRRMLPGIRAIVGASDNQVIVHTDRGLTALDASTGESKWHRTLNNGLYARPWSGSPYLLCAAQQDSAKGAIPQLVWVSAEDGRIHKSNALPSLEDPQPCLGPIVVAQNRLWALVGRGYDNPERELVELVRIGKNEE